MKLLKDWEDFKDNAQAYINEADNIENSYKDISTREDLEKLKEEYSNWHKDVSKYLSSSFDEERNRFVEGLRYPPAVRFDVGAEKSVQQLAGEKRNDLSSLKQKLIYYLQLLEVSDAIVRLDEIDLHQRQQYTTEEIMDLLLEKLYRLYDSFYYPVEDILWGNGIELKRHGEDREIVKTLKEWGYVNSVPARTISAQLTIEGKIYVEEKLKKQTTDYSKIDESQDQMNEKLDEIIDTLQRQGIGQQILFEELEELKDLYGKLNRKNWGQVLKGKLMDLVAGQVVNKDFAKMIFEDLTDQVLSISR